jgi:signal transduction histidine kinase
MMSVKDNGIGIPTHQQARIFGRFVRADNARAQGIHGTGLGLYLSRELIERHGGRIWFQSVEGQEQHSLSQSLSSRKMKSTRKV